MLNFIDKANRVMPSVNGLSFDDPGSIPPFITKEDFDFFFEMRDSLASCFYRYDRIDDGKKYLLPILSNIEKDIFITTKGEITIINNERLPILFEIEAAVHNFSSHFERLGKLLEIHYPNICSENKSRLDIAINKLPHECDVKKNLLSVKNVIEYIIELRNFSYHRMSLSHALFVKIEKRELTIKLPDLSCIMQRDPRYSDLKSNLSYNEQRTIVTEAPKWMEAIQIATRYVYIEYFNKTLTKHSGTGA